MKPHQIALDLDLPAAVRVAEAELHVAQQAAQGAAIGNAYFFRRLFASGTMRSPVHASSNSIGGSPRSPGADAADAPRGSAIATGDLVAPPELTMLRGSEPVGIAAPCFYL